MSPSTQVTQTFLLTTHWCVWACSRCSVERSDVIAIKMLVNNWGSPSLSPKLKAESAAGLKLWLSRYFWFMKNSLVKTHHSHRSFDMQVIKACKLKVWRGCEQDLSEQYLHEPFQDLLWSLQTLFDFMISFCLVFFLVTEDSWALCYSSFTSYFLPITACNWCYQCPQDSLVPWNYCL